MLLNVTFHRIFALVVVWGLANASLASDPLAPIIQQLLDQAEADFSDNRLTTPVNQNAYDRYQAVLLLDQGNIEAMQGIRRIANRYLDFSRTSASRGSFSDARRYLQLAININGNDAESLQVARYIKNAEQQAWASQRQRQATYSTAAVDGQQRIFDLNPSDLSQRNEAIVGHLMALGERVQNTREYVQIYARNDNEGRWIYQQMRNGVSGYRLRGNIQRSPKPRVELEAPLN